MIMDVYRLDPATYIEADLIENWASMIWTERFIEPSDFTLVTADIEATMNAMPLDSYISLRDAKEMMVVETHDIAEDEKTGIDMLTVTGRDFATWAMENRVMHSGFASIANSTYEQGYDPAITPAEGFISRHLTSAVASIYGHNQDEIPLLRESADYPGQIGSPTWYSIPPQSLYTAVMDIVRAEGFGIETFRPPILVADLTKAWIHLKLGEDRTVNQSENPPIVFDVSAGHFDTARYLFSNKDYKNIAYVFSELGSTIVAAPGVSASISGAARRVLYVHSDLTADTLPSGASASNVMKTQGRKELAKHQKVRIFEGKVSDNIPYKYQLYPNDPRGHYSLGDKVTVRGNYGFIKNMVVSEYIRAQDFQGEHAYPTLTEITAV